MSDTTECTRVTYVSLSDPTGAMMEAGRKAFRRHRLQLDDLHDYFPCDLDAFLKGIYRAMSRAS